VIRRYADADLLPLLAIVNQPEVSRWWGTWKARELAKEIRAATLAWTIELDGEPAGLVAAREDSDPDSYGVDLDVFLDSARAGHGIGGDALRQALRMLFEGRGHHRATIYVNPNNKRAIRAYEKVGFKPVGILRRCARMDNGKWHDELIMDLLAEEMLD
jgi:aminoglycoside 6'-N-acetyltransferase